MDYEDKVNGWKGGWVGRSLRVSATCLAGLGLSAPACLAQEATMGATPAVALEQERHGFAPLGPEWPSRICQEVAPGSSVRYDPVWGQWECKKDGAIVALIHSRVQRAKKPAAPKPAPVRNAA
jgi:hypothetical protein